MPMSLARRALLLACVAAFALPAASHDRSPAARALYAIGGGYEKALEAYSVEVIRRTRGPVVRMVMVPAAFADDPVLPEDPAILAEDVTALQAACDKVIDRITHPGGCQVGSVPLYVAADAHAPAIVAVLRDPAVNGIFFTGGDQGYAMRILAGTPAEDAMAAAAAQGAVFGGTSAGAAIQSWVMNAGYTDAGDSTTALEKHAIDLWYGRPPGHRGLRFGSRHVVIDEHIHSRGRLGRMINASAQTADTLGHGGLLGVGLDYDTGIGLSGDRWLGNMGGVSSGIVVDLRTARATHAWIGPREALSARRVLTHVLAPARGLAFDIATRTPWVGGRPVPFEGRRHGAMQLRAPPGATLMLSGDVIDDLDGPVLREFVRRASRHRLGKLVIIAAAWADASDALAVAQSYQQALVRAGWAGSTSLHLHGQGVLDPARARDATAVLVIGRDQSRLAPVLADRAFTAWLGLAVQHAEVVMFERAMAAAAGPHFDAIGEGDSADDAIAAFSMTGNVVRPGLGLIQGAAFETRLQVDRRWGRLYGMGLLRPDTPVVGISESTALVIEGHRATVVGRQPAVAVDSRLATHFAGSNGAFGALNVLVDVFQPGERLGE